MSRTGKGPRLWLQPERKEKGGRTRQASWIIRDDGSIFIRTGCAREDRKDAERALQEYIASKYKVSREHSRSPSQILVVDVLNVYITDQTRLAKQSPAKLKEAGQRALKLAEFWGDKTLADVNGNSCRAYVAWRVGQQWRSSKPELTGNTPRLVTSATSRRELEDLRAAINHHRREGLCSEIVSVVLPEKPKSREQWFTRSEAARLLWAAWRARQVMRDNVTLRATGKHLARFILVGLYTGTRHAAICGAAMRPAIGRGYVDLNNGVFYRRAQGSRETKKKQTPVRLHNRLLAHLRRWERLGIATHAVVEWNGKPIRSVRKSFTAAVNAAGLDSSITPHVLRHTAATWMMQNGADLWDAANFLGMTVEMLQRVYGHHHPKHNDSAVAAIGKRPGTQEHAVNKRVSGTGVAQDSREPNAINVIERRKKR
jgi:integrase